MPEPTVHGEAKVEAPAPQRVLHGLQAVRIGVHMLDGAAEVGLMQSAMQDGHLITASEQAVDDIGTGRARSSDDQGAWLARGHSVSSIAVASGPPPAQLRPTSAPATCRS